MAGERGLAPHWRKRVALVVLVTGGILIVDGLLKHRVVDQQVVLRYGTRRLGLLGAEVTYRLDGEVVSQVAFSYRTQAALREQRHLPRLAPGVYELDLVLRYGPPAERLVRLRRTLVVTRGALSRVSLE